PADLGPIHAIKLKGAKTWRQGAVVGSWLALTPRTESSVGIIFTQQTKLQHQCRHQRAIKLLPTSTTQIARQHNLAKTGPDKTADRHTRRLEHAAHFAVASLFQGNAVPAIAALAPKIIERAKLGRTIIKLNTLEQVGLLIVRKLAQHPDGI